MKLLWYKVAIIVHLDENFEVAQVTNKFSNEAVVKEFDLTAIFVQKVVPFSPFCFVHFCG